jgi:hypothetical protein
VALPEAPIWLVFNAALNHACALARRNPIERGLVASINRPGGNVTGVSWFSANLKTAKSLGLTVPPGLLIAPPRWSNHATVLLQLLTAAYGTSQTSGDVRLESEKWAKTDFDQAALI